MTARALAATVIALASMTSPGVAQDHSTAHLGTVDFRNSCAPPVQPDLQRAVALLHSFGPAAEPTFRKVLTDDPSCAVAAWGIASILMSNPLNGAGSPPAWVARAQAAIDQGQRIGAKTERERGYLDAAAAYYQDFAARPERERALSRSRAYEALASRYPDDDEAQIFSALYLASTQLLTDQTYAVYKKAAAILEPQFVKHPDHPGIAHYLIHVYDAPPLAQQGLAAAKRYAGIAPAAPHALHMPSHIFTRVGSWAESAATNELSAAAAKSSPDTSEQLHAMDYMIYAYLQMARDDDARRVRDAAAVLTSYTVAISAGPYGYAAIPARYAIERGDWPAAAAIDPPVAALPFTRAVSVFARALGAARSGDAVSAQRSVDQLVQLRDGLKSAGNDYWSAEVEVSRLGAAAWTARAQRQDDEALALMRRAADLEDKSEKHIVTPGRLAPARELLGDLLLDLKRPAEALTEFEASQQREPDRFRGLAGAGQAAAQSGNAAKAKTYYARLVETAGAATARPELVTARVFLTAHP